MASLNQSESEAKVRARLEQAISNLKNLASSDCVAQASGVAEMVVSTLRAGGKVIFCGNGGSSMDSGHLAAELLGRFYRDRQPLPAISLPDGTAAITAIANDYDYAQVFSRQVTALGRPGDLLFALSTSGNSANVVNAIEAARAIGMATAALTGMKGGRVAEVADICIRVPTDDTPRVQEACLHLGHSICEIAEERMFPAGTRPSAG